MGISVDVTEGEVEHTFARLAVDGTLHVSEHSTRPHYNVQENIWDVQARKNAFKTISWNRHPGQRQTIRFITADSRAIICVCSGTHTVFEDDVSAHRLKEFPVILTRMKTSLAARRDLSELAEYPILSR